MARGAMGVPNDASFSSFPSQSRKKVGIRELEIETQVAQMMGRAHTKAPDSSLFEPSKPGEGEDKTYLLFTTGSLTYSPHQIGELPLAGDGTGSSDGL